MKKLILIICVVIAACSSDDPQPKSYTSLQGNWEFTGTNVSGNFVIGLDMLNDEVIKSGTFKIDGHTHSIDFASGISVDSPETGDVTITFIDDDGDNLSFTNSTYSADLKTITSDGFFYTDGANYVEVAETVVITRR